MHHFLMEDVKNQINPSLLLMWYLVLILMCVRCGYAWIAFLDANKSLAALLTLYQNHLLMLLDEKSNVHDHTILLNTLLLLTNIVG